MGKFTQKVVQMMKNEKLFESQGGPIILSQVQFVFPYHWNAKGVSCCSGEISFRFEYFLRGLQIENEYEPERREFGSAGSAYLNWAAKLAVGMETGVPWVMCKEFYAPDPVVSTHNWLQFKGSSYEY